MRVGIDSYSYHRFFGEIREGEEDPGVRWNTWDFLERAADLCVDGVSLETCYLPLREAEWRRELAVRLRRLGLEGVLAWGHSEGPESGLHMGCSGPRLANRSVGTRRARASASGSFRQWVKVPTTIRTRDISISAA